MDVALAMVLATMHVGEMVWLHVCTVAAALGLVLVLVLAMTHGGKMVWLHVGYRLLLYTRFMTHVVISMLLLACY